jgi:hypothetical protein
MNKKRLLSFLLFLFCCNFGKAQDLIITITEDSLNCKITQIQKELIFFFYELDGEIIKSSISMDKVIYYQKDYYVMPGVFIEKSEKEQNTYRGKLRIGAYGGFSYLTGKIPDNIDLLLQDHLKRLKNGFHLGGDFSIFLNKYTALGAKYSIFITQDEVNDVMFYDSLGNLFMGKIAERVLVHYFAPHIFLRAGKDAGNIFFVFDGSIGCLLYRNLGVIGLSDFTMKGFTIGISIAPGIEFKVTPTFSINLNAGLTVGILNNMTMRKNGVTNAINDAKENISRVDLSLGFRWYH